MELLSRIQITRSPSFPNRAARGVITSQEQFMNVAADPSNAGEIWYVRGEIGTPLLAGAVNLQTEARFPADNPIVFRKFPNEEAIMNCCLRLNGAAGHRYEGLTFEGGIGPEDSEQPYGVHTSARRDLTDEFGAPVPYTEDITFYGCIFHDTANCESGCRKMTFERNTVDVGQLGIGLVTVASSILPGTPFGSEPRDDRRITDVVYRQNLIDTARIGIRVGGFRRALVEMNEFRNQQEVGGHADAVQSLWGGEGLRMTKNFMVDGAGPQGLFIKDGQVRNAQMDNNLMLHYGNTPDLPFADPAFSFYNCIPLESPEDDDYWYTGFGMWAHHNTVWDSAGLVTVYGSADNDGNPGPVPANQDIGLDHNVWLHLDGASLLFHQDVDMMRSPVSSFHDYNIQGRPTFNWSPRGPHDHFPASGDTYEPVFIDPDSDDYRLDPSDPFYLPGNVAGVDWKPGDWPVGAAGLIP